jgi:hypothetical protein
MQLLTIVCRTLYPFSLIWVEKRTIHSTGAGLKESIFEAKHVSERASNTFSMEAYNLLWPQLNAVKNHLFNLLLLG